MSEVPAVVALEVKAESSVGYPEPFKTRMGEADWRRLGDAFGLTQFGVNLETYEPGAQSALRHWHTLSDEFVYRSRASWCCAPMRERPSCVRACAQASRPACATLIIL